MLCPGWGRDTGSRVLSMEKVLRTLFTCSDTVLPLCLWSQLRWQQEMTPGRAPGPQPWDGGQSWGSRFRQGRLCALSKLTRWRWRDLAGVMG